MIKIVKNDIEKVVTKGAFENFYKKQGFKIADAKKEEKPFVKEATFEEKRQEENLDNNLLKDRPKSKKA